MQMAVLCSVQKVRHPAHSSAEGVVFETLNEQMENPVRVFIGVEALKRMLKVAGADA